MQLVGLALHADAHAAGVWYKPVRLNAVAVVVRPLGAEAHTPVGKGGRGGGGGAGGGLGGALYSRLLYEHVAYSTNELYVCAVPTTEMVE